MCTFLYGRLCYSLNDPNQLFVLNWVFMKLADNVSRHKVSQVFRIWPEWTIYFGVTCLTAEKTLFDVLGMLDSYERSLPFGRLVNYLCLILCHEVPNSSNINVLSCQLYLL